MADEVIHTAALSKVYPDGTAALEDVNLTVTSGEIFGCLGRNGAGKTTMIRVLTTLVPATSGQAWVCGYDVARELAQVRASIGVSTQQVALDDLMTAREHLDFVARLSGLRGTAAARRIQELLDLFGIGQDRVVAAYSGGLRRRLDIALSLLRQPRVLFLDEPTTGLDPQSRRALWEWVRRYAGEGNTVLLTSQYLEEVDELADRVGILDEGRLSTVDTPEALKGSYGARVLRVSVPDAALFAGVLDGLGARAVAEGRQVVRLDLGGGGDLLLETLRRLRELGVPDTAITVSAPTLEEVFLRLTGAQVARDMPDTAAAGVAAIQRSLAAPGRGHGR